MLTALRDTPGHEYQQLMEIAGVDYPDRPERFEVVYYLLSLTRNHRIRVKRRDRRGDAGAERDRRCGRSPAGSSAKCSTCTASPSPAIRTCAGSSPITASKAIRSARTSRSPAMSSCAIRKPRSASSMSRSRCRRISATSTS